ncbi:hypothetical protein [Georgenia sp. AZ-5]|uniref:hypothetical protein n=1 Tax=Georgenia sp. AZ-5 TaxID=3367526 RepID=UPI003754E0E5
MTVTRTRTPLPPPGRPGAAGAPYVDVAAPLVADGAANPRRLGAHLVGDGVDVAVHATRAHRVDVCLLNVAADGALTERRYRLQGPVDGIWHGHVPGVRAGQRYGFRVHGHWDPSAGLLHNPAKLLLDPYARALTGQVTVAPPIYAHAVDDALVPVDGGSRDGTDSAPFVAHGVVVDAGFDGAVPSPASRGTGRCSTRPTCAA